MVSAEYMKNVYGNEYSNGEIYLTDSAYSQVIRQTGLNKKSTDSNYQLEYSLNLKDADAGFENQQQENTGNESGICKIKLINHKIGENKNYAVIVKSLSVLKQTSSQIRVCIKKHDIDGMTIKEMESHGFIMQKDENFIKYELNQKMIFLKIRYNLMIGILCVVFSVILWKCEMRVITIHSSMSVS